MPGGKFGSQELADNIKALVQQSQMTPLQRMAAGVITEREYVEIMRARHEQD